MKILLMVTVGYLTLSLIYYHLPWSIRFPIHDRAPQLNRVLMRSGFTAMERWDQLALFGRDASCNLDTSARGDRNYGGFPSQGFRLLNRITQLDNRGYTAGYSESMKNPLWVAYRVFDVPILKSNKRPSRFKTDVRTRAGIRHDDYTRSGFDRGHMAPNYAVATRYGAEAQRETFLMSNIIPQTPSVNRYMWKDLEMTVAERYGRYFTEVWVMTGPVFKEPVEKLESGVPIPSHYYKIIADERRGKIRVLAFLVEKDCPPYTRIRKRLVSVDRVEAITGLDFFPDLALDVQERIETSPATRLWPVFRPALRYHLRGKTD